MTREEALSELDTATAAAQQALAKCQDSGAADLSIQLSHTGAPITYRLNRLAQAERMLLDWSDVSDGEDYLAAEAALRTNHKRRWSDLAPQGFFGTF